MNLSNRVKHLQSSPTIGAGESVHKLLARNEDIVRFDIGEPDFETPRHIKKAAIDAIRGGFTHYTSARGIPELRDAIVVDQKARGLDLSPSNVAFYPGSKFGLFCILSLLVDAGDEVLIQDPVWPTYASIVDYLGGTAAGVASWRDDDPSTFSIESFRERVTTRTKAILVNSPCNPTGQVVDVGSLEELLAECRRRKITLILDRIYSALVYGRPTDRIPDCDLEEGNLIVTSGFSKEFAMTGWRLGYTISSAAFTDLLVNLQDNTTTCATSFVQKAAVAALTGDRSWQAKMNNEYQARRDAMVEGIGRIPGWKCLAPAGAFYCFPRINRQDSIAFASSLLNEAKVSSVAGAFFGRSGEGHLRLSYTTSRDRVIEGMKRIREFVAQADSAPSLPTPAPKPHPGSNSLA
jgi:aspartate aminotransferase